MTESKQESRTISTIRTGTKVSVVVGLSLIAVAAYFYFTPVYLIKPEGGVFVCGSPSAPNGEAKNICEAPEGTSQARAFLALGVGILVIILGFALFGMKKVENRRAVADGDDHDGDDDHDTRDGADGGDDEGDRQGRRDDAEDAEGESTPSRASRRHAKKRRDEDELPSRSSRRDGDEFPSRSSRRTEDEFPSRTSRRDDDWASDGWR